MERKIYPSNVINEEWAFVAPYLTLMNEEAPQPDYCLREVAGGLHWLGRAGASWRMLPHDLPPWYTVYQQTQRWLKAGVFEEIVQVALDFRSPVKFGWKFPHACLINTFQTRVFLSESLLRSA